MITQKQFEALLPRAVAWAEKQEQEILRHGVPLTSALTRDALRIGLKFPEKVRLRVVEEMPEPDDPELLAAAELTGLLSPFTIGLTLQYGIFIRADHWGERRLVVHELAHTAQYERLGSVQAFLKQYLHECLSIGYPAAPLEQEAKRIEKEICGEK